MYYSRDNNGDISMFSESFFEGSVFTDKTIVRTAGGKLCFAEDVVKSDLEKEYASQIRAERNKRLSETDYLMLDDSPLLPSDRESIKAYRQALRDFPSQSGFPWEGWRPEADDTEHMKLVPWPQKIS